MDAAREIARLRTIWMALMGSIILYGAVGLLVGTRVDIAIPVDLRGWIEIFLAILAGMNLLVALLLKQMVAGVSGGSYVTFCILRWSLVESIGLFGLALAILGSTTVMVVPFYFVSLAALASMGPRDGERDDVARLGE